VHVTGETSGKEAIMYGTVARMKVKPGALPALKKMSEEASSRAKGFSGSFVYQMDKDPNEVYVVVLFNSKQEYVTNANSPEQDVAYEQMRLFLSAEPEWHDGEVISAVQV
jgi:heme-degrading monooxygenase HmoA